MTTVFTANTVRPCKVLLGTPFIHVHGLSCNISSMRCSVSSLDETPRRKLKIRHAVKYFWSTLRCFIWWWNTVLNAWYYFSNKMILDREIKDAKMSSFHLISKHSLNINFLCIFLMNYEWVLEVLFFMSIVNILE